MTVKNYSKITSLIILLIVPVHCDLLNFGFRCREATSFKYASKPLLLILSKSRYLKRYLSVDNNLTLNQSTQRLYTEIKLLLLNTWSVVISDVKKYFILTFSVLFWLKNCCNFFKLLFQAVTLLCFFSHEAHRWTSLLGNKCTVFLCYNNIPLLFVVP